jgi:hypothetical protein
MSNPTSNFGWQMPTATDLVTDLPADFEVFGQAVDTDFIDLLGGTTGQILSKTSATDLDFTWINNDQGDITGVTAGVGMTVANPTGPVPTVTNDMATTITAAGDIVVGTGSGTYDNLPIGTTAQVLTADTTVSPYKVKWATPATPSSGLNLITTQTFTTAASQSVNTCFSSTYTNYKIVVTLTTASADAMVSLNLRTGATDTTSTQNYSYYSGWSTQPGSINNVANGGVTSLQLFQTDSGYTAPAYGMSMDMYNPNVSSNTTSTWNAQFAQSSNSWLSAVVGGSFTNTTDQFDGFTLKISAGTMSGKAWVYGYSN